MEDPVIALVGSPNSGKTTLFNALTGQRRKVGNYAGATVEICEGSMRTPHGRKLRVVDVPGCHSLRAASPDEQVAVDFLTGGASGGLQPDLVVAVVDASQLERHLPLVVETIGLGLPVVIALNKVDLAERAGLRLDPAKLSEEMGVPVVPMRADAGKGVIELRQALRFPFPAVADPLRAGGTAVPDEARRDFVRRVCALAARRPGAEEVTLTDRIDRVVLHPVWGWVVFLSVVFLVFWTLFRFAEIPMGWIESLQDAVAGWVGGMIPEGDLRSLLVDGVVAGVGGVVVFLPQIVLLFLFIGLLEGSGYMARAAFLMDGVMSRAGLSGKAFLPLLSSHACAIPGVMATRTIDSAKERIVTMFVAPWMSCSARLPVYLLIVPMLLHEDEGSWRQALVLFFVYAAGILAAFVVARVLRGRLGADREGAGRFLLELPPYRLPQWGYVLRHTADRARAFLVKAGTVILGLSILLWAAQTYPKPAGGDDADALSSSLLGRVGSFIEPVCEPLGFDGRVGTAVLSSFAAREVFNASMAVLFRAEDDGSEEGGRQRLRERMAEARWPDGRPLFTPLTLLSLLVFYIYALQCLPTSAVVARESGSWRWAAGQFFFMSGFAYLASLLVYQGGRLVGL